MTNIPCVGLAAVADVLIPRYRCVIIIQKENKTMAHMTRKKLEERRVNNLKRAFNPMNTGTRNMGYESNNARKADLHMKLAAY